MFGQNKGGFAGFGSLSSSGTTASTGFTLGSTTSTAGSTGIGGFTFGATSSAAPSAVSSGQSTSGFSFGAKPAFGTQATTSQAAAATSTGTTGQISFGLPTSQPTAATLPSLGSFGATSGLKSGTTGFSFGSQPAATSQPASTAPTLGLGLKPLGTSVISTTTEGQKGLALTGATFGQTSVASIKPTQPVSLLGGVSQAAATTSSGFALSTKTVAASSTTSTAQIATSTATVATEKQFTYKQLEDVINKWVQELEEQETIFLRQAKLVNAWDKLLIENGEKITLINDDIQRLKTDQSRLDRELDFILSQQQELEEILSPLEEQVKAQQSIPYMQHADLEREKTYKMAENIDTQLKRMMLDIKDIINHINTSNANTKENEDPMSQIAKILNSHMDALQWVDQNAVLLQRKVEEVNKQVEGRRREHERSLRLTFAD
ncbi:nuclear pore glycoprotein p62-like [Rhopilema esculentum]|uniref:nuclear pore glycoprotein p62-like n=1 Tax=Rhopilema esculentum TaxID=499914 RepID=UPI0031CDC099